VEWLKELGFDHAFNYKKVTVRKVMIQVPFVRASQKFIKCFSAIMVPGHLHDYACRFLSFTANSFLFIYTQKDFAKPYI
jgi:hypothetical protein